MQENALIDQFHVTIDYRTKVKLAIWSGIISAPSIEQAGEIAERLLRRRSRVLTRVDRIIVR